MGLQLARLTKEVTYNVFPTAPAPGTQVNFFLPEDDAVTVLPEPQFFEITDAFFNNQLVAMNVGRVNVGGDFQTYLVPSQVAALAGLINPVGTPPCLDLPSFTLDRGIYLEGGACARADRRFTGCKFGQVVISADNTPQGSLFLFKAAIMGSTPAPIGDADLPPPPLSAYPADDPYNFFQTAGKLVIGGTRVDYQNLTLTIANNLVPFPNETPYYGQINFYGRRVTLSTRLLYTSTADRVAFERGAKMAASFSVDNGVTATSFNLGSNAIISGLKDVLPRGGQFTQDLMITAILDRTLASPTDLVVTVAPSAH